MKNRKKILAILVSICMIAILFVSATFAWFTDEEREKNTLTVGNVDIELYESQFSSTDGKTAEEIKADSQYYAEFLKQAGKDIVPTLEVPKNTYVENIGKNDAYVRVRVLVPLGLKDVVVLTFNSSTDWVLETATPSVTVDGVEYAQYTCVYQPILAGKAADGTTAMTTNALQTVQLHKDLTTEMLEKLIADGHIVEDSFNILVYADAIQAYGFDSATEAFAAMDGE